MSWDPRAPRALRPSTSSLATTAKLRLCVMRVPSCHNKPVVAIFDWNISATSPAGSVIRQQLAGLVDEFDFTVFSDQFDNPNPLKIQFVRVPLHGPELLKDTVYPYLARLYYHAWERRQSRSAAIRQGTEGQGFLPHIAYAHFCHRTFLMHHWRDVAPTGIRRLASRLIHEHSAVRERRVYANARIIVVPSNGLRRDIGVAYPSTAPKIVVIHNPIDPTHFARPATFCADAERASLGLSADDIVLVFVAKGAFGRKGLVSLLTALTRTQSRHLKLLVVGGSQRELSEAGSMVRRLGLKDRVLFTGLVADTRPKLWCADIYAAPSTYEAFSLAALEAAAARLPLLATPVSGVEEILSPKTGWVISPTADSIAAALSSVLATPRAEIRERGSAARQAVEVYDTSSFLEKWRACLHEVWNEHHAA